MIYRFDAYSLDTESLKLRRNDVVVPVEPQVFSVLVYLIGNRDRVVGKDELIDAVWDGRAISDGALNSRINAVRRAVGDDGTAQAVIKTFTRRGFRFAGTMNRKTKADPLAVQSEMPSIAVLPFGNLWTIPNRIISLTASPKILSRRCRVLASSGLSRAVLLFRTRASRPTPGKLRVNWMPVM